MLNILITGSTGRMGRALLEATFAAPDLRLVAALEHAASLHLGEDAGAFLGQPCGVAIGTGLEALQKGSVLVDFTRPAASMEYLAACRRAGAGMVIGTTGFSAEEKKAITAAAQHIPVVFAPNMSVGVNLLINLVQSAAKVLADGYDIEIIEAHHRHKVDAPSGTALRLGEAAASALGRDFARCAVYDRQGVTGERDPATIGFAIVRGGDVVGDHTVLFAGTGERVELTHKASSRATFALGALRAARFLSGRQNGLFDMQDVLQLR